MLSHKALLVCLSISQWAGRKTDKQANRTVCDTHAVTARDAVNTTKSLLPETKEFKAVKYAAGQIRTWYDLNTLPWSQRGMNIISGPHYMEFMAEFRRLKGEFEAAVNAFLMEYPRLRDESRAKLGGLFNELEYPTPEDLSSAFDASIRIYPVPDVGDFRTDILESEREEFVKNMREVESAAMREVWDRLHTVVKNAADKLNQPDGIFRDTLISNITDLCAILPRLNVTDDPALETARQEVEALASKLSPDVCRDNPSERQTAAAKLAEITARMSGLMGGV